MRKECPICDIEFKDGDDVVVIMVAKFRYIDSSVNYAIEHPTKCIEINHSECFDYDEPNDYESDEKGAN